MKWMASARAHRLVVSALVLFGVIDAASAQQPTQAQIGAIRQSCRGDYQRHCAGVPAGGPEALNCLKENAGSLSSACQRAVAAVGGSAAPAQGRAPAAAPATASPAAPAAPASPAPAYRAPPPPMSPRQEAFLLRRACGPDFRALCSDVPPGGGRIIACLEANRAYLSRGCRNAILSARQGR